MIKSDLKLPKKEGIRVFKTDFKMPKKTGSNQSIKKLILLSKLIRPQALTSALLDFLLGY